MNALAQYIDLYNSEGAEICGRSPEVFNRLRPSALDSLRGAHLPVKGEESYDALSVNDMFAPDYGVNIHRVTFPVDAAATFRCGVPNVSTLLALVVNDTFMSSSSLVRNIPEGVEVMSLAKAALEHPDTVGRLLGTLAPLAIPAVALNTLLLQDGVYIHIHRDVKLDKPIQLVNIFNTDQPFLANRRLLIAVDAGAKASVLACDHTQLPGVSYLTNQVTEILLGENASLDYYDLEESSGQTSRLSHLYAEQATGSRLTVNGSTLVGGVTRNNYYITAAGNDTTTRLAGMAVGSDRQVVDNFTSVHHVGVGGTSDQMFKYILEDASVGAFYGTITVDEGARHTSSNQSNRNILASKDARMYTRPQLEIYCDEVKCSHGSTVGQLDARALFYMRSRGIPEAEARLMLMQAFMSDVIDTVEIPSLRTRLLQLTEKRLCGERTLCSECGTCG